MGASLGAELSIQSGLAGSDPSVSSLSLRSGEAGLGALLRTQPGLLGRAVGVEILLVGTPKLDTGRLEGLNG